LTQLSRLDEQDFLAETEVLSFTEMATEAADAFSTVAERNGTSFDVRVEEGLSVRGNHEMLSQALSILLDNAVKYAKSRITVTLERRGNRVVFATENDVAEPLEAGPQEQFFHRFWRGDTSRSSENPGFGIGLSLARSIADKNGGSLIAESPEGNTVVISLSLRVAE
jgi:signal transduction histidine kinase